MKTINTNDTGIENLACHNSVAATVEHLELLLHAKGMKIFLRLDQAAEAKAVGLTMRPMAPKHLPPGVLLAHDPNGCHSSESG